MDACDFGYARIMRIVVHPACQQAGIGSQLLGWLKQQVNTDFLGTSFGASPELLTFWSRNGFLPVRLGLAADGVSGLHAAMMLWPASSRAQSVLHEWRGSSVPICVTKAVPCPPACLCPHHESMNSRTRDAPMTLPVITEICTPIAPPCAALSPITHRYIRQRHTSKPCCRRPCTPAQSRPKWQNGWATPGKKRDHGITPCHEMLLLVSLET
ncbi:GNAT family N-acetyltransferase [Oceanimonas sp. NS1]|nr:GNAT family N-acetyltransferase [Oceanimonas sp. NS1]